MIKQIGTVEAIVAINPKAQVIVYGPDDIEWIVGDEISRADIDAKIVELGEEYDAQEYARNRQAEYPSIDDLVVALYDTDDKSAIETKRAEVKAKYPKPE
jgi:hypothetical protein